MEDNRPFQAVIFDMDNTLLQSRIDFPAMKHEIYRYLADSGTLPDDMPLERHTTATVIEQAKRHGLTPERERQVWSIATRHELAGMLDAGLEPGVPELLASLHSRYILAVVTNNAHAAAAEALELTGIIRYFDLVVGRDQMSSLKPSPSGFQYVLEQFPKVPRERWLSVGDSWIDGKGSNEAGIAFVCYRTDLQVMNDRGIRVIGRIGEIRELSRFLTGTDCHPA